MQRGSLTFAWAFLLLGVAACAEGGSSTENTGSGAERAEAGAQPTGGWPQPPLEPAGSGGRGGSGGAGGVGGVGGAGGAGGAGGSGAPLAGRGGTGATADAGHASGARGMRADAGRMDAAVAAPADAASADAAVPPGRPVIVAVGYAGLRVASYDLGRTWTDKRTLSNVAEDDINNLRGVTYAKGLFVAVGHKIFTSPDGANWTLRTHPRSDDQWLGDVEYGNGRFVATGGYGYTVWSTDGIEWHLGGRTDNEPSRSLAFGNGEFRSQTDPGNWWRSTDGETWTVESGNHSGKIAFCDGEFRPAGECGPAFGFGTFVRPGGWDSGKIEWSEDGDNWHSVNVGYVGGINAFAFGYAP